MRTSVVVATFDRPALIERFLRDLAQRDLPAGVDVLVVENGPRRGVDEICRASALGGRLRYLYSPISGKSAALNMAVASTDADFIVFFDDDVILAPDIERVYVDAAGRHGVGHFFGGPLAVEAEVACPAHLAPHLPRSASGWSLGDREVEVPKDRFEFFFGANWAAFRADLEQAGGFAEDIGVAGDKRSGVGEEFEIQRRLLETGARPVYLPEALVRHPVPAECYAWNWVWRRRYRHGVTDWKIDPKYRTPSRSIFGWPLWLIRMIVEKRLKRALLFLRGASLAERTNLAMQEAYLAGLLRAARDDRRR